MADYAARNRRALAELKRLGVEPGPERGAVYRLRIEQGRRRGLKARVAVGKARPGIEKSIMQRRAAGTLGVPARRIPGGRAGVVKGRRVTTSTSGAQVVRALRRARKNGTPIEVQMTADCGRQGYRTVTLGAEPIKAAPIEDISGPVTVREV